MTTSTKTETAPRGAGRVSAYLVLSVLLAVAWTLWSGMFKPLLLGLGVLSCALTVFLARRMGYFDTSVFALHLNFRLVGYWLWLLREIVLSSIDVARVVLARNIRLSTRVVELDASDLDPVEQVLLGNSITLTPGTLTLEVADGRLLVHALTQQGAAELVGGSMKQRIVALRGD